MRTDTISVPTRTPPRWLNAAREAMLRTTGIERLLGRTLALITVTGKKSGRAYTTPVTYYRDGDTVIVLTRKNRTWWRNVANGANGADVELRLAGQTFRGRARASVGDEGELPELVAFLEHRRADARAYGLTLSPDGRVDRDQARALLPQIVVIRIALSTVTSVPRPLP